MGILKILNILLFLLIFLNYNSIAADNTKRDNINIDASKLENILGDTSREQTSLYSKYPYAVEYYGQTIHLEVPFSVPIIVELPDLIVDKTYESSISGLQIFPQGKVKTKILRIMATKNIEMNTVLHVTLANQVVMTFEIHIKAVDENINLENVNTRYKIIDKISDDLQINQKNQEVINSPDVINFTADNIAFRSILNLAGVFNDIPVKTSDFVVAEDINRKIVIKRYVLNNINLIMKSNFNNNRSRNVPVLMYGFKTFFCNKNPNNYWNLTLEYIKQIFPSYYKIAYKRGEDNIIPPKNCVPIYVVLWDQIKQ